MRGRLPAPRPEPGPSRSVRMTTNSSDHEMRANNIYETIMTLLPL